MKNELQNWTDLLLVALANGILQGMVLTFVVGLGLKLVPRLNATTRHAVLFCTLIIVTALPFANFLNRSQSVPAEPKVQTPLAMETFHSSENQLPFNQETESYVAAEMTINTAEGSQPDIVQDGEVIAETAEIENSDPAPTALESAAPALPPHQIEPVSVEVPHLWENLLSSFPAISREWSVAVPNWFGVSLLSGLALIALIRLGRLIMQLEQLRKLKQTASSPNEQLTALFLKLTGEKQFKRAPVLAISQQAQAPMLVGFRHPAVILPTALAQDTVGIEQILRHELAHLDRDDDWSNLAQQLVKSLFFVQPAVHWLSRRLTIEREIACDDHVLAAIQAPHAYALLLAEFAAQHRNQVTLSAAPAAWSKTSQLKERINMILNSQRNSSPRLSRVGVGLLSVAAIIVAALVMAGPRLIIADEAQPEQVDETSIKEESASEVSAPVETTISANGQDLVVTAPNVETTIHFSHGDLAQASAPRHKPHPYPMPTPAHPGAANPHPAPEPPEAPDIPSADISKPGGSKGYFGHDADTHERLGRLERQVQELLRQRGSAGGSAFSYHGSEKGPYFDPARDIISKEQIAEIEKQARKAAEQADREVKEAMKHFDHSKNSAKAQAHAWDSQERARKRIAAERQLLQQRQKALEMEANHLERQIEQLEQEEEKLEEQRNEQFQQGEEKRREEESKKNKSSVTAPF
ncbi:MAG: M56 family metallopeptidase [Verrucomicrobiota bacterium]|nr:M56 family metallopeptidase [Verrucomicrobiota bacterium]